MLGTLARIRDGRLFHVSANDAPIIVGSEQWYAWLERHSAFAYESAAGSFMARKFGSSASQSFWRAYSLGAGRARAYLGCSRKLTLDRMSLVAQELGQRAGQAPALPPREEAHEPGSAYGVIQGSLSQSADEAFAGLPGDAQRFLLSTSFLQPLCAALCHAVVQRRGGRTEAQILAYITTTSDVLVPVDREGIWYRYQQPIAEMLLQRLRALAPRRERILRRRAAAWYASRGMLEEAIGQWLAAQEWNAAAGLVEQVADSYLRASNLGPLEAWLAALPDELIHDRPRLSIAQANLLARQGNLLSLEPLLASVETNLKRGQSEVGAPADQSQLEARVMVIRASLARIKGDQAVAHSLGQQALAQLPPDDRNWRVQALFDLAVVTYLNDQLPQALGAFSDLGAAAQIAGQDYTALLALHHQGAVLRDMGRLSDAERLRQRIGEQSRAGGRVDVPIHAFGDLNEALICIERDALPAAEAALCRGRSRLTGQYHPTLKILLDIAQTRYALATGDLPGALAAVATAEQHLAELLKADHGPTWRRSFVQAWRARVDLARGASDDVQRWARSELERPTGVGAPIAQWSYRSIPLMLARADLLAGRGAEARQWLEPLRERAQRFCANDVLIELLVLLAWAHHLRGAREAALGSLARAVQLGEPEGYVRTILDEGTPIWELLELLHARGSGAPAGLAAGRLLARLSGTEARPHVVEPLTSREQQVLALVSAGYSNHEIALALYLTVGTVKSHMSSIHSKLGVQRRGQAVAYAREIGLLVGLPIPVNRH